MALFVALGGTGYAATQLPKASVGAKQLKKNSVSSAKVKDRSLLLDDFKRAERTKLNGAAGARGGQGLRGLAGVTGLRGGQGSAGIEGTDGAPGSDGLAGTPGTDGDDGGVGPTGVEQVVVRSTTLSFLATVGPNGQILSDDVQCLTGESVVGGGADIDPVVAVSDQPNAVVTSSRPADSAGSSPADGTEPRGWFVAARRNSNTATHTVSIYVLCASAAP